MQNQQISNAKPLGVIFASAILVTTALFFALIGVRSLSGQGHDLRIALIPATIVFALSAGLFFMRKWAAILTCLLFAGTGIYALTSILKCPEFGGQRILCDLLFMV